MRITDNTPKNPADYKDFITQLLSRFPDKHEGFILLYLLSIADDEWTVNSSVNAMAVQLNMNRKTLLRHINSLCEKGYTVWETIPGLRHPNLLHLGQRIICNETEDEATEEATEGTSAVATEGTSQITAKNLKTHCITSRYEEIENPFGTRDRKSDGTSNGATKKEEKQNKEEFPPAPPEEEKKQKKEKNTHTNACARRDDTSGCFPAPDYLTKPENLPTSERLSNLERRRQYFLASLTPYHERYGQEMVTHFADYWTEPNRSQTKMRFELQRTWSTPLRLATWARNDKIFTKNNNNHDKKSRPTAAEFIYNAQRTAIEETERFIREAEIRRGGLPPHLPF